MNLRARVSAWWRDESARLDFRWRSFWVVLAATFVILLPEYHRGEWFNEALAAAVGASFADSLRDAGITFRFALRMIVPLLAILALRERFRDYGLGLGQVRTGAKWCALFYVLYVPCFLVLMSNAEFREHYSGVLRRYDTWGEFLGREVLFVTTTMIAGEFLYRGFLLFGVKKDFGAFPAMLVSLVPYVYGHHEKPAIEAFGSFPVGLALAYLAVKTDSIWYGVLLHASIAIGFNAAIFALG